jgi:hypothetical protein
MASTDWKETIAPNEASHFDTLAGQLREVQRETAKLHGGTMRGLHAKAHAGLKAELTTATGLPDWAKVGIFAAAGSFKAWVRFSNGALSPASDRRGDVRGLAVKVTGVPGTKLIPGLEDAPTQDFLTILSQSVPFPTPASFIGVVRAVNGPKLFILPRIVAALGGDTFRVLGQLKKGTEARVDSLAEQTFYSALPIRWGSTAVKYSFVPVNPPKPGVPVTNEHSRYADDLRARLAVGPLVYSLKVQPFSSEAETPIEDPTRVWTTPWVDVAELRIPAQDPSSEAGTALAAKVETFSFDCWHAPVEFRPLGAMMRARSHAYRDSVVERKAAKEPGPDEW